MFTPHLSPVTLAPPDLVEAALSGRSASSRCRYYRRKRALTPRNFPSNCLLGSETLVAAELFLRGCKLQFVV